jgi:hypothetical protein
MREVDLIHLLKRFEAGAVFSICFLLTMVLWFRTDLLNSGSERWNDPADHWKYEYVAEHPLGSSTFNQRAGALALRFWPRPYLSPLIGVSKFFPSCSIPSPGAWFTSGCARFPGRARTLYWAC